MRDLSSLTLLETLNKRFSQIHSTLTLRKFTWELKLQESHNQLILFQLVCTEKMKRTSEKLKRILQRRERLSSQVYLRWLTSRDGYIWLHKSYCKVGPPIKKASLSRVKRTLSLRSFSRGKSPKIHGSQDSSQLLTTIRLRVTCQLGF